MRRDVKRIICAVILMVVCSGMAVGGVPVQAADKLIAKAKEGAEE